MSIFNLPTSVILSGSEYAIRSDFRDILNILNAFDDPELSDVEKQYTCLYIFYPDFSSMPQSLYEEAYEAAMKFIDNGQERKTGVRGAKTMDWEQDAQLLFPAINKVAGYEVRSAEYLHWWTFTGFFMEIKDSLYSTVMNIRNKKAKGKKLEKWEKDFWRENKQMCVLQPKLTSEEKAEKERLKALL